MNTSVARLDAWQVGRFKLTDTGVKVKGKPTIGEWIGALRQLRLAETSVQFWVADMLNLGGKLYPDVAIECAVKLGWAAETIRAYRWVAMKVSPSVRRRFKNELSFKHFMLVASFAPRQQRIWLKRSTLNAWTGEELARKLRAAKGAVSEYALVVQGFSKRDRDQLYAQLKSTGRKVSKMDRYRRTDRDAIRAA